MIPERETLHLVSRSGVMAALENAYYALLRIGRHGRI
jgi:hypothetical protein